MMFLLLFIVIGIMLVKMRVLKTSDTIVLSKLENCIFIPALVAGTFIKHFTISAISSASKILLTSLLLELILIPVFIWISKRCSSEKYLQNIYTYGLCFSNFGFMGNAVVCSVFPETYSEYILFTLPLWAIIYLWGVPYLLIPAEENRKKALNFKALINPMFISMIIGMIIGVSDFPLPESISSVIDVAGSCMSPIAMILTGMTFAGMDSKSVVCNKSVYIVTALRLIFIPILSIFIISLFPISKTIAICIVCSLAMPLGLNTVVVPRAYGRDTSVAAGMAMISHFASLFTIPVVFVLLRLAIA